MTPSDHQILASDCHEPVRHWGEPTIIVSNTSSLPLLLSPPVPPPRVTLLLPPSDPPLLVAQKGREILSVPFCIPLTTCSPVAGSFWYCSPLRWVSYLRLYPNFVAAIGAVAVALLVKDKRSWSDERSLNNYKTRQVFSINTREFYIRQTREVNFKQRERLYFNRREVVEV